MNIVPGLHSALISIPKLADAGYTTVFKKDGAAVYNDYTTTITATNKPVLESKRCEQMGMWKLDLDPNAAVPSPTNQAATLKTVNVVFDLPSARKTLLWYHASAGFPTKAMFIDAVCNGNYSTWPKLTVILIKKYFPDSTKTINGALERATPRHLMDKTEGIRQKHHQQRK